MTRQRAIEVAQEFIGPCAGAYGLAVWPVLARMDWGVLVTDLRNADTRFVLNEEDAARFREIVAG